MANKKGTGLMMVWMDVPSDKEEEFNRWYNEEHLAELVAIPGVLNAARYEAVSSGPKHLACYELESRGRCEANPSTPWSTSLSTRTCRQLRSGGNSLR